MAIFRALTSKGLVEPLVEELHDLGIQPVHQGLNWVEFKGSWQQCFAVNTGSRIATRVILPVLDFKAFSEDELYHKVLRHDFTQYIDPDQTLSVAASLAHSNISDQRLLALKVKDAVVDQFRQKFKSRPSVDRIRPDLRIFIRCVHNTVSIAIDTSGRSLSDRGYRIEAGIAPLKEHLAAGLLRCMKWQPQDPLLDPMCGSGTFLIEAASLALKNPPCLVESPFAFQRFKKFRGVRFLSSPRQMVSENVDGKLYGSDIDSGLILRARKNAERAKVADCIQWQRQDFRKVTPPAATGTIVVNPPYGERLKEQNLEVLYQDFAAHLKTHFKGWTLWLLSGNAELTKALHLKAQKKILVTNGDIECRFLCYPIS